MGKGLSLAAGRDGIYTCFVLGTTAVITSKAQVRLLDLLIVIEWRQEKNEEEEEEKIVLVHDSHHAN